MISVAIIAAMIGRLAPAASEELRARYAADIVAAAEGYERPDELAVALLVTQHAESNFRESVERCTVTGDQGRAITGFQLHPERFGDATREELCADNRLAARTAGAYLSELHRKLKSWTATLIAFCGCKTRACKELRGRDVLFLQLLKEARGAS